MSYFSEDISDLPTWPRVEATLNRDGSGVLLVDGVVHPVAGATFEAAQDAVIGHVAALAASLNRPVRMITRDPDGTWPLVVTRTGRVAPDATPVDLTPPTKGPAASSAEAGDVIEAFGAPVTPYGAQPPSRPRLPVPLIAAAGGLALVAVTGFALLTQSSDGGTETAKEPTPSTTISSSPTPSASPTPSPSPSATNTPAPPPRVVATAEAVGRNSVTLRVRASARPLRVQLVLDPARGATVRRTVVVRRTVEVVRIGGLAAGKLRWTVRLATARPSGSQAAPLTGHVLVKPARRQAAAPPPPAAAAPNTEPSAAPGQPEPSEPARSTAPPSSPPPGGPVDPDDSPGGPGGPVDPDQG